MVKKKLEKWANEPAANRLSYMEEEIAPEDLEGLTEDEKKYLMKRFGAIDEEDLNRGLTKQAFQRKMTQMLP